ncbi:YcaO-like family protein [Paracoccus sp. MBLB3053]|uniref:YcaO-like family protein n=1 Tax=Paracoccus aurantius TaxID=3073814 RepID=A0ABU2HXX6_9RHOB|nr:YcaO-like family protein [Paracoccus sp. MBLB3053]MDS9469917.1 YcaO-like family protein [Paracoccus sp. MBLB3053]
MHPRGLGPEVDLQDDSKGYLTGTHRGVSPARTVERVKALMPQMGITRIANVTGLDRIGIPVVMVCRPNARSLAVSQGKGWDLEAATASGLMEAAELYHAEHIELPLKFGSMAELRHAHEFVDVGRLARTSDRFHPNLVTLWAEGRDLISGTARWLPYETVRANLTLPQPPGSGCFDCSSNGLASGNSMIEAICHAICEVIERDATAMWKASTPDLRAATGIDPESVTDAACRAVLARLGETDFDVTVWDITSDIGVPSFYTLLSDRRDPLQHVGIGVGTHPSRAIALLRSLTEAVQVRTTYISGARDDLSPVEYSVAERSRKAEIASIWREAHLPSREFAAIPEFLSDNFGDDLEWLLTRLRRVGITEVVAVDLTKASLGIPVVKVVIPGLEGPDDHAGYIPGERARSRGRA